MARPRLPVGRRRAMASRKRGPWWRVLLGLAVFAMAFAGYGSWQGLRALRSSDWLSLRTLRVEGCRVLPAARVRERLEPLLGRPLFSIDPDSLEAALSDLPRVAGLRVSRRPPGTLLCRVTEASGVALWLDGGFVELDGAGQPLDRFGDAAPDLPIIRPSRIILADSLRTLALAALDALRGASFDLADEVSEITAESTGIVYYRSRTATRVLMGWEDFAARARCYRDVYSEIAAGDWPAELDLRYRDQVVARHAAME